MVFNATFNNISVISWGLILLVEETGVPGEKPLTYRVTYRFMNEIIVTNESEWAEHMYRVSGRSICTWCLHVMYSLCYFVSLALEF